jgi:hypothetical protein
MPLAGTQNLTNPPHSRTSSILPAMSELYWNSSRKKRKIFLFNSKNANTVIARIEAA